MNCTTSQLSYEQTGYFSKIIVGYLKEDEMLKSFYGHPVSPEGIKSAIADRKAYATDRKLLVSTLRKQYANQQPTPQQEKNLEQLLQPNCFTITAAHQPNIFTGHLYFIYKILHAVKLAEYLSTAIPGNNFVPVFYMGSEDADLDELGHIYLAGEKYEWKTAQTGAVGRMKVDKELVKLIETISGQLTIHPFGEELIKLLKDCYTEGATIEQATFKLINILFGVYGLIVLLPDDADLKRVFIPVAEKELTEQFSHKLVEETATLFPKQYKVQAGGRELNLFYLKDAIRERIEKRNAQYSIINTQYSFTGPEVLQELKEYPERFSPNVILRPVFQEMVLPNIAFIGGGGEIAYWLELKKVFDAVDVPFPVLVLRNSFMIVERNYGLKVADMGFKIADMFRAEDELLKELVKRETAVQLSLDKEKQTIEQFYNQLKNTAGDVDASLLRHTEGLKVQALNKLEALEKKMLRAEKKKFEAQQRQIRKLKAQLFPNNGLQERMENVLPYYANHGMGFIKLIHENSMALEQQFVILEEK